MSVDRFIRLEERLPKLQAIAPLAIAAAPAIIQPVFRTFSRCPCSIELAAKLVTTPAATAAITPAAIAVIRFLVLRGILSNGENKPPCSEASVTTSTLPRFALADVLIAPSPNSSASLSDWLNCPTELSVPATDVVLLLVRDVVKS